MLTEKEKDTLLGVIKFEDNISEEDIKDGGKYSIGWSWQEIPAHPSVLNNLVAKGCLRIEYKSNSYTGYRLTEEGRELAKLFASTEIEEDYSGEIGIPNDIFDIITGYDDIKELFKKSLLREPVDFLMVGVPGSAKTMMLSELERVKGATPVILGGTASKVGIVDLLFDYRPKILLIDEFEHIDTKDYTILLSLCETRTISETKHGKTRRLELPNTRLFAGCNNTSGIPVPVLDRLQRITFTNYTYQEFIQIVTNTLIKRNNIESELAEYIANETWAFSHSVRQAVRISKLAHTKDEVDNLLQIITKYNI